MPMTIGLNLKRNTANHSLGQYQKHVRRHQQSFGSITDPKEQMDRWVEHYSELSLRETVVNYAALNWITFLPVMDELDAEPTIQEFVLEYPQIKAENWTHLNNGQSGNNNLMKRDHILLRWGFNIFSIYPRV